MVQKICKKCIVWLLALALFAALIPATSAAALPTEQEFAQKIAQFREEFPVGKYWNDANGTVKSGRYRGTSLVGDRSCTGASCGSLAIDGAEFAWQCHGYAMLLADRVFGSFYNIDPVHWKKTDYARGTFKGELYAGDVVRISLPTNGSDHSVFVYRVTNDTVYYTDCNRSGKCKLDWDTEDLATFKNRVRFIHHYSGNTLKGTKTVAPQLTLTYHANGGVIPGSEQKTVRYQVITEAGLNLRGAPSVNGNKIDTLPKGTEFQVTETKTAEDYIWGKTKYEGKSGWCVISKKTWVKTVSIPATSYYLDSKGMICKSSTLSVYQQTRFAGTVYPTGLSNASSFGLEREGYLFLGWSTSSKGGNIVDQNRSFLPEELSPALLTKGDQKQTYYAIWQDLSAPESTLPFIDVSAKNWFYEGVEYTYEKGWMNGVSNTTFAPLDTTTRAMLVTVLYRIEGSPAIRQESGFSDVPAGKWYSDAITWAAENNIVEGMGDGTFAPNAMITRAQMATVLFRYARAKEKDEGTRASLEVFADHAQTPQWAKEGMRWAVSKGIIAGIETKGKRYLQNNGEANRAQIATVLMRYGKEVLKKK